jgi:5-methylthioadenosine/S-adenosylhomocysteine deaminase
MHCQETEEEVKRSLLFYKKRPWDRLKEFGYNHSNTILVHMVAANEKDIESLQGVHIVTCPNSNLKLGSGLAPISAYLDAGIHVALGTDSAASNNSLDMFSEMRSLALSHKGHTGPMTLPAWQVLECATINGAKALGLQDKIGSLTTGKCADLIAINLDHPRTYPHHSPLSQLVHAALSSQVTHTWVDGNLLVKEGKLTNPTLANFRPHAKKWMSITQPFAK